MAQNVTSFNTYFHKLSDKLEPCSSSGWVDELIKQNLFPRSPHFRRYSTEQVQKKAAVSKVRGLSGRCQIYVRSAKHYQTPEAKYKKIPVVTTRRTCNCNVPISASSNIHTFFFIYFFLYRYAHFAKPPFAFLRFVLSAGSSGASFVEGAHPAAQRVQCGRPLAPSTRYVSVVYTLP